jgi:alpha-beta hydrolase superfamily lysophospholipase
VSATYNAIDFIFEPANLKKLSAPTLILSSSDERVVDGRGHGLWVEAASQQTKIDVSLEVIHGARHELFSEIPIYRDAAIRKIRAWFGDFVTPNFSNH